MLLQAQLEGLESIFFELFPFQIGLKRQQIQDYYNKRFTAATESQASVARGELRRNFNTRANQVRNLVDSAESIGDVDNKFNLITAAACLPDERNIQLKSTVLKCCRNLIFENEIDAEIWSNLLLTPDLTAAEARTLLACTMFIGTTQVKYGDTNMSVRSLLANVLTLIKNKDLLPRNDPFFTEGLYFIEGMEDDASLEH
jgi:hypothetical protein